MTFTIRARRALGLAETETLALGHPCVGSHHLLLGLFLLGQGVAFHFIQSLGITHESLQRICVAIGPVEEPTESISGLIFGASAARALERAERGATVLSDTYVGTEHILMALLAENSGGAARVFEAHKTDTRAARRALLRECGWSVGQDAKPDA
jgi:ATP-dependent Clp protease ATP-binding subunit ClpC